MLSGTGLMQIIQQQYKKKEIKNKVAGEVEGGAVGGDQSHHSEKDYPAEEDLQKKEFGRGHFKFFSQTWQILD